MAWRLPKLVLKRNKEKAEQHRILSHWFNDGTSKTHFQRFRLSGESNYCCALRFTLYAARFGAGEATIEGPAHRIPKWCLIFRYFGSRRRVPTGSARAWVHRGEKHCY